jgi:DNA-binding PadR family transcriptional regulator
MNVRTLCLGILSLQEASGYEIKKDVEDGVFAISSTRASAPYTQP